MKKMWKKEKKNKPFDNSKLSTDVSAHKSNESAHTLTLKTRKALCASLSLRFLNRVSLNATRSSYSFCLLDEEEIFSHLFFSRDFAF